MRLSSIEIENFKAVCGRQCIDLRPVTLLFGPNSAGKSTIFKAIEFAQKVISGPRRYNIFSNSVDEGSARQQFLSISNGHDVYDTVMVRLDVEFAAGEERQFLQGGLTHVKFNESFNDPDSVLQEFVLNHLPVWGTMHHHPIKSVGLEFQVEWNEERAEPYILRWHVFINSDRICSIESGFTDNPNFCDVTDFNFEHPLLRPVVEQSDGSYLIDIEGECPLIELLPTFRENSGVWDPSELRYEIVSVFPYNRPFLPSSEEKCFLGSLEPSPKRLFVSYWNEMLGGIFEIVSSQLCDRKHIGPLREVPSGEFEVPREYASLSWLKGEGAWNWLLSRADEKLLKQVNRWMSGEDRLNIPYRVKIAKSKRVPADGPVDEFISGRDLEIDLDKLRTVWRSYPVEHALLLDDLNNRVTVALDEVGMGVSQVLPILVACCFRDSACVLIEQPELHLHPAAQVALGDLFIDATVRKLYSGKPVDVNEDSCPSQSYQKSLLVETHSEHLILRLLRRIRETSEGTLPPGISALRKEDLAVIYAEPSSDGVRYKTLRVDDDGEFLDAWPRGFFEERGAELF